jgi:hypothetical protein
MDVVPADPKFWDEAFKGAGFVLNEGRESSLDPDGRMQFAIEVTQKTPLWLKLITDDGYAPTHGPWLPDSEPN